MRARHRFAIGESATTLKVKVKDDEDKTNGAVRGSVRGLEDIRIAFECSSPKQSDTGLSAFHGTFAAGSRATYDANASERNLGRDFDGG
jgi:hypothetical protein